MVDVRHALVDAGYPEVLGVSPIDPGGAVLLAAAFIPGVESGWGDDGCYYLAAPGAGEVGAHDPYDELHEALVRRGYYSTRLRGRGAMARGTWRWTRGWSGIHRQHLVFAALQRPAVRRLLEWGTTERVRPQTVWRLLRQLNTREGKG